MSKQKYGPTKQDPEWKEESKSVDSKPVGQDIPEGQAEDSAPITEHPKEEPTPQPLKKFVRVVGGSLNVRSQPTKESKLLTTVKRGKVLELLSDDGKWLKIKDSETEIGYILKGPTELV